MEKAKDGSLKPVAEESAPVARKRGRWDKTADGVAAVPSKKKAIAVESTWDKDEVSIMFLSFVRLKKSKITISE